ncbi:MAG: sigma-70 family RNA polymerase sigma factor [Burkholderiales bacterium]|nr:sigma-70 family RNA polymerase sigma factor [Phycisphaerae bacterium]
MSMTMTKTATKPRVASIPRLLRQQAEEILVGTYAFMDAPEFRRRDIEQTLFATEEPQLPMVAWYQPTRDDASPTNLPRTPQLMSTAEERLMFLRYNYAKFRLAKVQKTVKSDGLTRKLADEAVLWHHRAEHFREYLTRTNLALVLAMAKRTRLGDIDFAEIVSEGNMALLRAVEKFNVGRGFKFSTYACRAILKAFSRASQKHNRHRQRFPLEFEPEYEKSDWSDKKRDAVQDDLVDELKQIVDRNLAELSSIEQTVIKQRFNWSQEQDSPLTLEQVGRIIGVTKERVRQIQNKALIKIRRLIDDGVLKSRDGPLTAAIS